MVSPDSGEMVDGATYGELSLHKGWGRFHDRPDGGVISVEFLMRGLGRLLGFERTSCHVVTARQAPRNSKPA